MRTRHAVIFAAAILALVGCGSSSERKTTSGGFAQARGCSTLTTTDVARVIGKRPAKRDLAPPPEDNARCSSAFFLGGTELVVAITERAGDGQTLKRVRAVAAKDGASVRAASGLGDGAFVAGRRFLGFQRAGSVVTLETGYSGRRLILTAAELERLARLVAQRL